jgi:hypothetical protein
MMNYHYYVTEDDEYFDIYINSLKHDFLRDRLIWQHEVQKQIGLEYQLLDDDYDF